MEIKRVIFQEDELVHRDVQTSGQAPPPQGQEQEVTEDEQVVAEPLLLDDLIKCREAI